MNLSRKKSLSESYEFSRVKKYGASAHSPLLIISWLKSKELLNTPSRFGIIVSNKVDKKSTERHRLKRIIARLISENLQAFGNDYAVVVVAKPGIAGKSYEEISVVFNQTLSKISLP